MLRTTQPVPCRHPLGHAPGHVRLQAERCVQQVIGAQRDGDVDGQRPQRTRHIGAAPAHGGRRSLAGERRGDICTVLAAAASRAFDLLEPSLGGYGIRPAR
jgi:hypothetical protein